MCPLTAGNCFRSLCFADSFRIGFREFWMLPLVVFLTLAFFAALFGLAVLEAHLTQHFAKPRKVALRVVRPIHTESSWKKFRGLAQLDPPRQNGPVLLDSTKIVKHVKASSSKPVTNKE